MSPIVPAAFAAAGAYLFALPAPLALLAATVGSGVGIFLDSFPGNFQRLSKRTTNVAFAVVVASVALLVGAASRETAAVSSVQVVGVMPFQVRLLAGTVESDPVQIGDTSEGRVLIWIHAKEVSTNWATVDADASVGVFVDSVVALAAGMDVSVRTWGIRLDDDGRLFANAIDLDVTGGRNPSTFRTRLIRTLEDRFDSIGPSASTLLSALLLGRRSDMSLRTETLFRQAGASHVLALSGMHLGILAAAVAFALRPIVGQTAAGIVTCCFAILYTLLVGPRPSLVRAVIMCLLLTSAWLSGRRWHLLEVLSAAFVVQLLIQPQAGTEIGFVLSYAALVGIAVVSPVINRRLQPYVPPAIRSPLSAGLGAQIATLPIVLGTFGVAYPVGVVSGIILAPMVALFMIGGAAVAAASFLTDGALISSFAFLTEKLASGIETVAWFFAGGPSIGANGLLAAAMAAIIVVAGGVFLEWRRVECPGA